MKHTHICQMDSWDDNERRFLVKPTKSLSMLYLNHFVSEHRRQKNTINATRCTSKSMGGLQRYRRMLLTTCLPDHRGRGRRMAGAANRRTNLRGRRFAVVGSNLIPLGGGLATKRTNQRKVKARWPWLGARGPCGSKHEALWKWSEN